MKAFTQRRISAALRCVWRPSPGPGLAKSNRSPVQRLYKEIDERWSQRGNAMLLRLVPKGQTKNRADYYIDEDTKNLLLNVIRFQMEICGGKSIPIVRSEFGKIPPDHYVLQWRKRAVGQGALNTFIRFLLHGLAFRTSDGTAIQLTSHILRHVFATELATLNVPVDIIAKILHQRDTTVTKYYSQPTGTQVLAASELIFIDRIDMGAEALRNPEEIGRRSKKRPARSAR